MSLVHQPKRLIVLLAALVAFGPLSIDMYLPSVPLIAGDLQASERQVQMTIGLFLAGFSLGMLFYGPLSDRFGRRRLLLGGICLYMLASLGCALASEPEHLIAWRLLQAVGGASASVLARVIVRDLFPLDEAARVLSLMQQVTMIATLIAPLLGGYLILLSGWRVLFFILLGFAGVCLVLVWRGIPETLPRESRGASLGLAFGAFVDIARQPRAIGYILCMGLAFAGMFAFITASPFIYIEFFDVSMQHYGWLFSLNILGIMCMSFVNARLVRRLGSSSMLGFGASISALSGIALLLCCATGWGGLPAVVVCVLAYVSVTGMIAANCLACLMSLFPRQAGAAAGLAAAMQFGLGTLGSALVSMLYDGSPWPMGLLIGCAGVGVLLAYVLSRR
ncbi:DHA1 family bicyclomycin/chloramphenicol resistance-like MFS transporter [Pseudomonas sp. BIGb0408]|uniref:Bcr/CflA family efflux transporter n=1 Tax=Phytopseudomonas flavescens TaxID=29435 RepID=A0A7Y9XS09_9GAMM|nr:MULTISPECIES: Bcr/CflA family multidrug efflux MFS transporter [Pseudomonas]MCW2294298.1 DHA1 family bicyclomycin/chloramphenicol resistance-like MFS transporter [Pseudomonas sp. BIGb0408]NYH76428.1 DHA1 family bicyclomycin/chloramphenicol resistance-like MFS transporter [Pseudomonas flavescens]